MTNVAARRAAGAASLRKSVFSAALLLIASLAATAAGAQLFSDTLQDSFSNRQAGDSPVANLQVSSPVMVTSIAVLNDIEVAQNQKFLIYDSTTATFLLISSPQAFAADAAGSFTWKTSASFPAVTLVSGHDYLVGAISDAPGHWAYNTAGPFAQGAITSLQTNGNVQNYAVPESVGPGSARIPLILNGGGPVPIAASTPVPTLAPPALLWTALALALFGLLGLRRGAQGRR